MLVDDFAGDDGGCGATLEGVTIEGGIAGFARGIGDAVSPRTVERENGEVGRFAESELAFFA